MLKCLAFYRADLENEPLTKLWTNISPTGAYWNHTVELSNNRIPAMGRDETHYAFAAATNETVYINVLLSFRRAFITLAGQKSWEISDILMEETSIQLP